tara:strand:+ start:360 stop:515 length:156 start_codon:yes stop_codon:yes gene_type:complete
MAVTSSNKKYKVSIEWETEVEAKDHDDAVIKGWEEFFYDGDHKDFETEEIK